MIHSTPQGAHPVPAGFAGRVHGERGRRLCGTPLQVPWASIWRACLEEDEAAIPAGGRLAIPSGIAVEPLTPGIAGFVYRAAGSEPCRA